MTLEQWVKGQVEAGIYKNVTDGCRRLSKDIREAGIEKVSSFTLKQVVNGLRLKLIQKAAAIQEATGGKVTIPELTE